MVSGWCDVLNSFDPVWALAGSVVLWLAMRSELRGPFRLLAAFGFIVPLCLVAPDILAAARDALRPVPGPAALRIVTFNVWDKNRHPGRAIDLILKQHADLVALQEDVGGFAREETRLAAVYPYHVHCTRMESGGCSLWSKRPFLAAGELVFAPYGMALVWGRVLTPDGKPATVFSVHLAWPFPPHIKQLQMGILARHVARHSPGEAIILGDFNQTPWSFALRRLDRALHPLVRRTHALFSWPAFIKLLRIHTPFGLLPIDQVYAAPAFSNVSVERLPASSSDHFGLVARFAPRP
jgi:endonuclease/exonuclease/phosphatase (EEP) superfamily protein YafD